MKLNTGQWTAEETAKLVALRAAGATRATMAETLARAIDAIDNKLKQLRLPAGSGAETTLAEDIHDKDEKFWKRQHAELSKKYQGLLTEKSSVDRLVSGIRDMAPKSYEAAPAIKTKQNRGSGKPQSAVLELSDTHIGAVVQPNQTLTFGRYDFPTFLARLKYLEESVISIVSNHTTTPVPELVIAMLGDLLDGALAHSNECGQLNPMFNQFFSGAHALAQFVRNLAPHFPEIRVYDVVGNHPRYQNQRKMPTVNKHSNFDKFLYAMIRELVRDVPNVKWDLTPQPFQVFDVQGFSFFAGHGETLRGGDKALGVPNHAIGRLVSTTSQLFGKNALQAPNYYLFGHLHRPITLPHATGEIIVNGGFVGLDGFGLSEMFTPSDPLQKLFFVHPVYGKTATYDIGLKFAEVSKIPPYSIPEGFLVQ